MAICDLGTECLCSDAMRERCEFRAPVPNGQLIVPADRYVAAIVILCTALGFLAGALFVAVL